MEALTARRLEVQQSWRTPRFGSGDKVVMLVLLPDHGKSGEVGLRESHLEDSFLCLFVCFVKNVITWGRLAGSVG